MKKYFILSAAALALASCSNDEFLGEGTGQGPSSTSSSVIAFGSETGKATRAGEFTGTEAAEKLNNNFIVYGFKYYTTELTAAADVTTATKQQKVFDNYTVEYKAGSDNTTESNTNGWEYVGIGDQTIKYWDYETTGYVFSAVSGTGITAEKIESVADGTGADTPMSWTFPTLTRENTEAATVYDKGWVVTIPQGGSLSDLYASERVEKLKLNSSNTSDYNTVVNLKFYNMGAKVRFGMYEKVPGYKVHIDKFYYNSTNSTTNFGVDGNFTTLKTDGDSKLIVTYYNSGTLLNRPKVTPLNDAVSTGTFGEFGANIQATDAIETTSAEATYDQNGGVYTDILPMTGNGLTLKVDYTLTSTDGSGETIHVKGATAKVPANFTDWKANFAYTYLFKISDNTNGNTGTIGTDPAGLYPITFDAVVVGNEDGIQETITSVANPSITTYQAGVVVTENDEYKAGDIYFEEGTLADIDGYKVYEVNNLTGNTFETQDNMTEEVIANYLNNFCVLTEIDKKDVSTLNPAGVPLSDGTYIQKAAKKAYVFKAEAGKTYVICDEDTPTKHYKLVKVQGGYTAPTFTAATDALGGSTTTASITTVAGTAALYLSEEITNNAITTTGVEGAIPSIAVTTVPAGLNGLTITLNATAGKYDIAVNDAAVYAGTANGTYTLSFGGATVTITVDIATALRNTDDDANFTAAAVTAGDATGVSALLKIADAADNHGVIVNDYTDKGVVVTNTGAGGLYKITATQNAKPGVYQVTIAGKTVAVTVTNYAFAPTAYTYNMKSDNSLVESATKVVLKKTVGTADAAAATGVSAVTIDAAGLTLTGTDGEFTATATAGGTYKLSYQNTAAKATVIVNKYAIENGTIARSTGRLELGVTVNGDAVNASAAKVKITKDADSSDQTANFTITTNGQKVVLSGAKSTLATGAYTVHYYLEAGKTNEVATSALTVN